MKDNQDNYEYRKMSAKELSLFIVLYRKQKGWTQETLAAISGISVRAVQRAENGEIAGSVVRRALARAFELEDIDVFNKQIHIPNEKTLKEEYARIQQETLTLSLKKVSNGKILREMTEQAEACAFDSMTTLSNEAEKCFAELQDYLKDYKDIYDELTAVQKLDINDELQKMLDQLEKENICLGIAVGGLRMGEEYNSLVLKINHYVVGKKENFPTQIMVKK